MKLSLNWLQDFVDLREQNPHELSRRITASVAEVEDVEIQGALLDNCCVGKVLTVDKHPGADRLSVCTVQTDKGVKNVVCGGSNLRVGMRVAMAHVGARVKWHGGEMMTLAPTKIRGVESHGMICASEELDLASRFPAKSDKEIMDLGDGDDGVGRPLKEYLGLNDVVFHVNNHAITHRADLFSQIGFARELVALGLADWKKKPRSPSGKAVPKITFAKAPLPFKSVVDDASLCSRYCSCVITIDALGETPQWMKERLAAVGWRSVSLPVDITNYVATETGMPLHSFDADDIDGDFHLRASKKGDKITTLDSIERELPDGAIVLSDKKGIFDLLGIMGGLRSSTKEGTKRIYLHAAILDPSRIRKTIIATGHRTEASTVYEKGVPKEAAMRGLLRAIELFLELVPGAKVASKLEEWGDEGKAKSITFPLASAERVLGIALSEKKAVGILQDLGCVVKKGKTGKKDGVILSVTPPLHRLGDLRTSQELIEEVGRIAGFDDIVPAMPRAGTGVPYREKRVDALRRSLAAAGFFELLPLSLVGPALLKKAGIDPASALAIHNPLGEELGCLQPATLPNLLDHAERMLPLFTQELNRNVSGRLLSVPQQTMAQFCTFTLSHVFSKKGDEHTELGVFAAQGAQSPADSTLLNEPFLHLKEALKSAFASVGYAVDYAAATPTAAYAHPGRTAEIFIHPLHAESASLPQQKIGMMYEVHPSVRARFGIPHRAAAASLNIAALLALPVQPRVMGSVPQFPAVSYDVTLPVRQTEQVGDLLRRLRGSHENLEDVGVKDLYTGPSVDPEHYALTLRFTYRAADRTLTESEAQGIHAKVLQAAGVDAQ